MKMKSTLLITMLASAMCVHAITNQSALPGVLHTDAAERMQVGQGNASIYSYWMFDDDEYFQNDQVIQGDDTMDVTDMRSVDNFLALALGLPGGIALSIMAPIYYENVEFGGKDHRGVYLGDLFLKSTWTTPPLRQIPWLSGMVGFSTNFGTAETGQGYVVRELEYAYTDEGCYLYSCGSRHTGLQFRNLEARTGASVDLQKTKYKKPAKIHANLYYRWTAFLSPGVGVYEAQDEDVYDILGFTLAGETQFHKDFGAILEYRHEQRTHTDYSRMADLHQMHYGAYWLPGHGLNILAGFAHGILNDRYAKTMYAKEDGSKVARYGFKTPDLQWFTAVTWEMGKDKDDDRDGVPNKNDLCPHTPAGTTVNIEGCAEKDVRDADRDGVPDSQDQCPNTPRGTVVDALGCPKDSDHDGVPDVKDKCPGTAKGVAVNEQGCAIDSDKDGVLETKDRCPNTLPTIRVDQQGCPIRETQDLGKLQKNINFEVGSDKLTKASLPVLDNLVDLLMNIPPGVRIEVQGHTDSDGKASYNLDLSQRRAESVVKYLVSKGISADRLRAKGYGMEKPIADNRTLSGKRLNRRVELVPIE